MSEIIWGILQLIYLISCIAWYNYIVTVFGKGGIWEGLSSDKWAYIILFTPLVNTIFSMVGYIYYPPRKK